MIHANRNARAAPLQRALQQGAPPANVLSARTESHMRRYNIAATPGTLHAFKSKRVVVDLN